MQKKQDHSVLLANQLARSQSHWELVGTYQAEAAETSMQQFGTAEGGIYEVWATTFPEECDRLESKRQ